jgi:imidazolonepropionase
MEKIDILIKNANELITLKGLNRARTKKEMNNLSIIENGSIAINKGKIVGIGKDLKFNSEIIINASGKTVLPGFVDSHTHLVFAGSREYELEMKLKGYTYMDILKKGGGIYYTVEKTKEATDKELLNQSKNRLYAMLKHGTTTCEAKSGYGLDTESELRILKIQKILNKIHPVDIISTFLGAHAIPKDKSTDQYVDIIINNMIPKIKNLAKFCDVFCEKGVFNIIQSKRILEAGKKHGLVPKIHADEIIDTSGASLAADINAISADHLLMSSEMSLRQMSKKGVIAVLLPGTPFLLMQNQYASARKMIDMGISIALGSDLNPNCWIENMQFIIQLACLKMKMTPAEAITASTFNSACSLGLNNSIGSLEKGKKADVIVLNCSNHKFIPYHVGLNLVDVVIKNGKII